MCRVLIKVGLLSGILSLFSFASNAEAASLYSLIDIGVLPGGAESQARAINENGQITGISSGSSGSYGFIWSQNEIASLGSLLGMSRGTSSGWDINEQGQIVGSSSSSNGDRAFRWSQSNGMTSLNPLPGNPLSTAYGINNTGQVVGYSLASNGDARAVLWSGNQVMNLGVLPGKTDSYAESINDLGHVVGYSDTNFTGRIAFLWTPRSGMVSLGTLPGGNMSYAWNINNNSLISGTSNASVQEGGRTVIRNRAFISTNGSGLIDLGVLPGFFESFSYGSNDKDQVVGNSGSRAFIWEKGIGMTNLNTLISPSLGWTLTEALDINNKGQIVGYGKNASGNIHGFLLTPVPAIPTPSLLPSVIAFGITMLRKKCSLSQDSLHGSST
jgi:probable HAF family extracellular repeat protein